MRTLNANHEKLSTLAMITENTPSYNISTYWRTWLRYVMSFLLIRMTIFFNIRNENIIFVLICIYAVPAWLCVIILNYKIQKSLMDYLEQHHNEKWHELFGYGIVNYDPLKRLKFLYSQDDLNDEAVKNLKLIIKQFIKLALVIAFTMPIIIVMTILPVYLMS